MFILSTYVDKINIGNSRKHGVKQHAKNSEYKREIGYGKTLFKKISRRRGTPSPLPAFPVPARYAKKHGIIGNTQGARNDTTPAKKATEMEIESMFCIISHWRSLAVE